MECRHSRDISSGTNCYGALKVAEQLRSENKGESIVTLIPDSCENYGEFLRRHFRNIMGVEFDGDVQGNDWKNLVATYYDITVIPKGERSISILPLTVNASLGGG